jgi:ABC-type enterochelin transport system substrate-binding protein
MEYFKAKSELKFMEQFHDDVIKLGTMEDEGWKELRNHRNPRLIIPSERQKVLQKIRTFQESSFD